MNPAKSLGLAVLLIAISVGLVNLPATASASSTAATSSATAERAVVDHFACQDATRALPQAQKAVKKAKELRAKKKRALKRAKGHHASKAKVTLARKAVKKAKRSLKKKRARVERLRASKKRNCAQATPTEPPGPPDPSSLSADQLGQLLALLSGAANGGSSLPFDPAQITGLLDGIIPGGAGALDPAVLTDLLAGFNSGALDSSSIDPAALAALLAGLSPDQLTELLGGSLSPDTAIEMFRTFVSLFGELTGDSFELPDGFDPSDLLDIVGGLLGGLLGGGDSGLPGPSDPLCDLLPILC